jgi:hypothetical protein
LLDISRTKLQLIFALMRVFVTDVAGTSHLIRAVRILQTAIEHRGAWLTVSILVTMVTSSAHVPIVAGLTSPRVVMAITALAVIPGARIVVVTVLGPALAFT